MQQAKPHRCQSISQLTAGLLVTHRRPVQVQQPVRDPCQLLRMARLHHVLRQVRDERRKRLRIPTSCVDTINL